MNRVFLGTIIALSAVYCFKCLTLGNSKGSNIYILGSVWNLLVQLEVQCNFSTTAIHGIA